MGLFSKKEPSLSDIKKEKCPRCGEIHKVKSGGEMMTCSKCGVLFSNHYTKDDIRRLSGK